MVSLLMAEPRRVYFNRAARGEAGGCRTSITARKLDETDIPVTQFSVACAEETWKQQPLLRCITRHCVARVTSASRLLTFSPDVPYVTRAEYPASCKYHEFHEKSEKLNVSRERRRARDPSDLSSSTAAAERARERRKLSENTYCPK